MRIIRTDQIDQSMDTMTKAQVYNGLDCMVTRECFDKILSQMDEFAKLVYSFQRAMQGPALTMMLRGFKIDEFARADAIGTLEKQIARVQRHFDKLTLSICGEAVNPASHIQVKDLFFKHMNIPEMHSLVGGKWQVSSNRDVLERLKGHFYAMPLANMILTLRDLRKQLSVFRTGVDPDGRLRTNYNVSGTETGRWSSNKNIFGRGTNLQNIAPAVRHAFVADAGYKLCYLDLEQAESRLVGLLIFLLFGETEYLDACESGDLHTTTCKLIWNLLKWTGDKSLDREIADTIFYRDFSYRDMSKRGGHGTNYYGQAATMAKHLKVPVQLIVEFQAKYFTAFGGIRRWHLKCAQRLLSSGASITPLGRKRRFFGRLTEDETLREFIANDPQSVVGDLLNRGLYNIWRDFDVNTNRVQCLAQIHDAILLQYPENQEDTLIPLLKKALEIELNFKGRKFLIPSGAQVGWNWGKFDKKNPSKNPDGLKDYKGHDDRQRYDNPTISIMDRRFH